VKLAESFKFVDHVHGFPRPYSKKRMSRRIALDLLKALRCARSYLARIVIPREKNTKMDVGSGPYATARGLRRHFFASEKSPLLAEFVETAVLNSRLAEGLRIVAWASPQVVNRFGNLAEGHDYP
jgi:hypothetical protein